MKKDNTVLLIVGLAAAGAGIYFYMKSKQPVKRGYSITVPNPTSLTTDQYGSYSNVPSSNYSGSGATIPAAANLLTSIFSLFKRKTVTSTPTTKPYDSGYLDGINQDTPNFF